ncbi:11278_t:CDS:2, partial [Gigaspora margarita]
LFWEMAKAKYITRFPMINDHWAEELNNPSKILEATENDVIFLEKCESNKENLETFMVYN